MSEPDFKQWVRDFMACSDVNLEDVFRSTYARGRADELEVQAAKIRAEWDIVAEHFARLRGLCVTSDARGSFSSLVAYFTSQHRLDEEVAKRLTGQSPSNHEIA